VSLHRVQGRPLRERDQERRLVVRSRSPVAGAFGSPGRNRGSHTRRSSRGKSLCTRSILRQPRCTRRTVVTARSPVTTRPRRRRKQFVRGGGLCSTVVHDAAM
jgi:hypothetical protein